ncbi:hypothetical protein OJAV_G00202170 [Oryzias javanicus]|uniref:Histamine N-methyltransferase n=1 Tax=Oryzias javanicus TaxID=123683 RepID=A0A437C4W6_ORYJA|nr:hypothetical protein OJAV_G00202170 [Oryzias javanicus]
MSSETESGSPTQGIPEEGARRGGVMLVESLPEEGTYLLRALKAEELFQLVHGCMSQRTEKKLDELREELSPDIVDGALEGLFQALTGESESTSRSPSSAEESSSDRSEVWEKIKALYHKLNLFNPSETGVSGLKLPTPKLKVEKLRKLRETGSDFPALIQGFREHSAILQGVRSVLPKEFQRIAEGKSSVNVLGVGSGGGEMDVQMLSLMEAELPAVPIAADIVEGSAKLIDHFKALVAKSPQIQKIPFSWHAMSSEDYEKLVRAKGDGRKFDFIHMIQMIYYVENLEETIKFYHSLLKNNGRLMIIVEAAQSGWDILWKTFKTELCGGSLSEYRSSGEVVTCLQNLGLTFQEHLVPNSFDITDCFDSKSVVGDRLLSFMTAKDHFRESFTPEVRAAILELLRNKCSTEKDGRVFFNSDLKCILVHA